MDFANKSLVNTDTLSPKSIHFCQSKDVILTEKRITALNWSDTLPPSPGMGWAMVEFFLEADLSQGHKSELIVSFLGAYELYLEGVLIGQTGRVAVEPSEEKAGLIDRKYILPDSLLTQGRKVLLLRYSDHKNKARHQLAEFTIEPYNTFYNYSVMQAMLIYSLAGIFLIVALYYFFLYFNTYRKLSYLLFALLCGVSLVLIVFAYSRNYWPYTYAAYHPRQLVIGTLLWIITLLLPLFYLYYFNYPNKKKWLIVIPALLVIARLLGLTHLWIYTATAIMLPLYFLLWALKNNKQGSTAALIGFIVFTASFMYFNISVYVGFGVLIMATLFSLSVTLGKEREQHEASLVRSSRLEAQLLKKNIKPHFLMNTLTNIISLIEYNPRLSVRLIEALSSEFYAMMDMADKKLIPVEQEIELCQAHLEVMSIRNDICYEMDTRQVNLQLMIPPAILHTLVENGITHNDPINGKITFCLSQEQVAQGKVLCLRTYGLLKSSDHPIIEEGTGLKYVKSRLEESFPGRWDLQSGPTEQGWITKIIFK